MPNFIYNNKKCFYEEVGSGYPLVFLHGNTASSKMFSEIIEIYKKHYKVILIDFLGHGKSERVNKFHSDLWFDEAMQVIQLLEYIKCKKASLIGSSGGALVALNVALERPDLIESVIADSFEGETPLEQFTKNVIKEREASKQNEHAKAFYVFNQGEDWEQVVDNDTNAIFEHYKSIGKFFHKPLEMLRVKALLTGSKEDEFAFENFYIETYSAMLNKIPNGKMHIFDKGGHPAILSNPIEFFNIAKNFLD